MAKKPRKWSNLEGQVPEEPKPPTERELVIRQKCDELRGLALDDAGNPIPPKSMRDLAAEYRAIVEEETFEKLAQKKRSIEYEALERVIFGKLIEIEEFTGQDMFRGEGMTFSPQYTPMPVVTDRAALRAWVEATGQTDILEVPGPKLKSILHEALDTGMAVAMTPAERAQLKPGQPGSGMPPPGVSVYLRKGVHPTVTRTSAPVRAGSDD